MGCAAAIRPPEHSQVQQHIEPESVAKQVARTRKLGPEAASQDGGAGPSGPDDCKTRDGTTWLGAKAQYRATDVGYPQIIQGQEYAPIEAIQALYAAVSGTSKLGDFGFEDPRELRVDGAKIVVTGSKESVEIELGKRVRVGQRVFADPRTKVLFQTLGRLLTELGSQCKAHGVRGRHMGTRAYRDAVRFEFSFGPVVVSLESAANGPRNRERLYVLDVVEVGQSALWADAPISVTR